MTGHCVPLFFTHSFKQRYSLAAITLAVALGYACPANAITTRVDDNGTIVSESVLPMQWAQLVPGRGADHNVHANLRVALRLNLTRWLNQPVKLYMALEPGTGSSVTASWRTQGRLLPGDLRTGARTLVFNGVVRAALLEETIDLTLRTDGRSLVSPQTLQFYFEIDTP